MNRKPLGQILVSQGLVTEAQVEQALEKQRASGRPLGDELVYLGFLDEATLLRALAEQLGISYVSRAQVAESPVPPECLEVVPLEEAEEHVVFPVWYNSASGELVLVVADPIDQEVIERIRQRVQTPVVTTILALPSTIRAAIDKHYKGIADAFERAEPEPVPVEPVPAPPPPVAEGSASADKEWKQDVRRLAKIRQGGRSRVDEVVQRSEDVLVLLFETDAARAAAAQAFLEAEGYRVIVAADAKLVPELTREEHPSVLVIREATVGSDVDLLPLLERLLPGVSVRRITGYGEALTEEDPRVRQLLESLLEHLDVLLKVVGLESGKGASGPTIPKLARQVGERLELAPGELDELSVAAYMRELAREELTWPSLLDLDADISRDRILQEVRLPIKHLARLGIPVPATHVLAHLYERFDGTGMPDGLAGDAIPAGARVLAVIAAFHRLSGNCIPDTREEVAAALRGVVEHRVNFFDPLVVNAFVEVLEKGLLLGELDVGLAKVLIIDPDPVFKATLGDVLMARGYRVLGADTLERAREILRDYVVDVVISEVRLPDGDPLAFTEELKASGGDAPPLVFVTTEQDPSVMGQALERGAEDYVLKMVGDKVIQAKVERILERMSRERTREDSASQGVSGRLAEMGLTDIIQVLGASGKTARVDLRGKDLEGAIWVSCGDIVHAVAGDLEGEDAFYQLIRLRVGEFSIENVSEIERHTIEGNYEMVMLEGLRRMDEAESEGASDEGGNDIV